MQSKSPTFQMSSDDRARQFRMDLKDVAFKNKYHFSNTKKPQECEYCPSSYGKKECLVCAKLHSCTREVAWYRVCENCSIYHLVTVKCTKCNKIFNGAKRGGKTTCFKCEPIKNNVSLWH